MYHLTLTLCCALVQERLVRAPTPVTFAQSTAGALAYLASSRFAPATRVHNCASHRIDMHQLHRGRGTFPGSDELGFNVSPVRWTPLGPCCRGWCWRWRPHAASTATATATMRQPFHQPHTDNEAANRCSSYRCGATSHQGRGSLHASCSFVPGLADSRPPARAFALQQRADNKTRGEHAFINRIRSRTSMHICHGRSAVSRSTVALVSSQPSSTWHIHQAQGLHRILAEIQDDLLTMSLFPLSIRSDRSADGACDSAPRM